MTEQQIRDEYRRLFSVQDDSKRLERLQSLRQDAEKAGLADWRSLIDVRIALIEDRYDDAIAGADAVAAATGTNPEIRAWAMLSSAKAHEDKGDRDQAVEGYTAIIEDPAAPPDPKAWARVGRGITFGEKGEIDKAIADCTAVIDDPAAPPDPKALARVNRGVAYDKKGETDKEIADYTAVIDDPPAPPDLKARARLYRGAVYAEKGETDKAIAGYTAVIDDPGAPPDQKALAQLNRGVVYGQKGETDKAIADCTAVIDDPAPPPDQKAIARRNRAVAYGEKGETDKAIADYAAVIDDPAAPPDVRSYAGMAKSLLQSATPKAAQALAQLPVAIDPKTRQEFREAIKAGEGRKTDFFSESLFDADASFLLVLREWNSYTPAVPNKDEPARGGGYFLKHGTTGVVVDPGFDFLEMFAEAGGRIQDIGHIVITHAHNDHTADLESILMLLREFNETRLGEPKKVNLYLSQGASRKFQAIMPLTKCNYIGEVFTMNRTRRDNPQVLTLATNLHLHVLPAYHDDVLTSDYAVGLGFEFTFAGGSVRRILITSDTAIQPAKGKGQGPFIHTLYPSPFGDPGMVELLVPHIGSIPDCELTDERLGTLEVEEMKFVPAGEMYPSHLGLRGTFFIIHALEPKAALISEFGEEMKAIWIKAVRAIGGCINSACKVAKKPSIPVFAGDPVIIYNIRTGEFLCHENLQWRDPRDLRMVSVYDPARLAQAWPSRPYLFPKSMQPGDESDYEDKVKRFHEALKARALPHFKK